MKRLTDLTIAAGTGSDIIERGELTCELHRKAVAIALKVKFPIANATGGAVVLSDAQKQTLFSLLRIADFDYGKDGKFDAPYSADDFRVVHRMFRRAYKDELNLYTDSATGLSTSLPNAATTNVYCWVLIPVGKLAMFDPARNNPYGMGKSQLESTRIKLESTGTAIAANLTLTGNVTVDVYLDEVPCDGDPWCIVPRYFKQGSDTRITQELPEGLWLAVEELTAAHASSTLTDCSFYMDNTPLFEKMSVQDTIQPLNNVALLPSAGVVTDRVTVLFEAITGDVKPEDLPVGRPRFTQDTKTNASVSLAGYYLPVPDADKLKREVQNLATANEGDVKLVRDDLARGTPFPARLAAFAPFRVVRRKDAEYEALPGLEALLKNKGGMASENIPGSVLAQAKARAKAHTDAGEEKAADLVVDAVSAAIPGAVPSARGFKRGNSPARDAIARQHFR